MPNLCPQFSTPNVQVFLILKLVSLAFSCTNVLVTPGATTDGSSLISYNMDSFTLYGYMARYEPGIHSPGTTRKIYDWETGLYRGEIPEAPVTYSVVGNMNEFQLAIGETTFGGLDELGNQPGAIIDYGSLIYIALQRSKTAREAISVMTSLVQQYGYGSEGESFSIADPKEVWIMEMIGKGPYEKGAVWVARKLPDGYVCAHANQARIRQFPRDDPDTLFATDIVSFAKSHGFYPINGSEEEFSFSDVYNPLNFEGARACEARVWSIFNQLYSGMDQYLDYAQGYNLTNRMPLWIKPNQKISVAGVISLMRNHFEGTWFDLSSDVGAGPFRAPYRWRPLTWQLDSSSPTYVNERPISTQQTGSTFVAQMRANLPDIFGGVSWYGVDDSSLAVHVPIHCGVTDIPDALKLTETVDLMHFSFDSAFWVFNLVNNFVYTRYGDMYPDVLQRIKQREDWYITHYLPELEAQALQYVNNGQIQEATELLTNSSRSEYILLMKDWQNLFKELFVKYMDGNIKYPNPKNPYVPIVHQPGYGAPWYSRIAKETGTHYEIPTENLTPKNSFWTDGKRRKI